MSTHSDHDPLNRPDLHPRHATGAWGGPPPPKPRRSLTRWTLVIVFWLVLLALFAAFAAIGKTATDAVQDGVSPTIAASLDPTSTGTDPVAQKRTLRPSDYQLKIKTLSKTCFGSAGCNLEIRITATALNPASDGVPVELTFKVTGATDGAQVDTIEVDDSGQYSKPEMLLQTDSRNTKLKAVVTSVEVL
jgi:hypothetical protein